MAGRDESAFWDESTSQRHLHLRHLPKVQANKTTPASLDAIIPGERPWSSEDIAMESGPHVRSISATPRSSKPTDAGPRCWRLRLQERDGGLEELSPSKTHILWRPSQPLFGCPGPESFTEEPIHLDFRGAMADEGISPIKAISATSRASKPTKPHCQPI